MWLPVRRSWFIAILPFLDMLPAAQGTSSPGAGETTGVVLALAVILVIAMVGGQLAVRIGQPAVLGEIAGGVIAGNLQYVGIEWFSGISGNHTLAVLAEIGVLLLLFEAGIESTVRDMARVGWSSLAVAVIGVVTPFVLGWGALRLLQPGLDAHVYAFVGATLTATSVGITARVLNDLGRSRTPEARIILGAAVIDDILGLVILAIVTAAIGAADTGAPVEFGSILWLVGKAALFLVGALVLGTLLAPRLFRLASRLEVRGVLLGTALAFCFVLAGMAHAVGLAPIVGAYAAGLIIEEKDWEVFVNRGEHSLPQLLHPVAGILVPVFFVLIGMRVELPTLGRMDTLGLALLLTAVAIIGKQACAFGVLNRGVNRLAVGVGMIPRGEVGLIFAGIGAGLTVGGRPVIDTALFSGIVVMVMITTMVTPPALKWSLSRRASVEPPGPV